MMKYIVLMGVLFLSTACSLLPGMHGPVALEKAQTAGQPSNKNMDHKNSFFVARKGVEDGYVFIFHIMPAPEGDSYSRSDYHLMVSIEKNGQPVTNLTLYSEVKHPDGTMQKTTSMMRMGNWYMALYNLSHDLGQHWLTVTFEQNGKSYSSGVYYPERAYPLNEMMQETGKKAL